jgi:hypothetical protein
VSKGSETGAREGGLLDTVELFYQRGLLQEEKATAPTTPLQSASQGNV